MANGRLAIEHVLQVLDHHALDLLLKFLQHALPLFFEQRPGFRQFLEGVGLFGFGVARLAAAESALRRRHRLTGRGERLDGRIELTERFHRGRQCRPSAGDCWPGFASPDRGCAA